MLNLRYYLLANMDSIFTRREIYGEMAVRGPVIIYIWDLPVTMAGDPDMVIIANVIRAILGILSSKGKNRGTHIIWKMLLQKISGVGH